MEELEIVRVLNIHNPWWNNKPIAPSKTSDFKRGDFYIVKKNFISKEIISIIGPRRVGKTILIHQLIQDLLNSSVDPKRILYLSVTECSLSLFTLILPLGVRTAMAMFLLERMSTPSITACPPAAKIFVRAGSLVPLPFPSIVFFGIQGVGKRYGYIYVSTYLLSLICYLSPAKDL